MSEWAEILLGFTKSLIMNPHKISAHSDYKQKSFVPKKICGMLVFETLKNKKSDFLNSNTCFCLQLYGSFFGHKSTHSKGNYCFYKLKIRFHLRKKNRVPQKLKILNKSITKIDSSNLIFLNYFFIKILLMLDIENWLWKSDSGTCW